MNLIEISLRSVVKSEKEPDVCDFNADGEVEGLLSEPAMFLKFHGD